jgi:ankyrin repeat protein
MKPIADLRNTRQFELIFWYFFIATTIMDSIDLTKEGQFIEAAEGGNVLYVLHNLMQKDLNINATNDNDETALLVASENGRTDIVSYLLKHKEVNVNHQDCYEEDTALIRATANGHLDIVCALLQHEEVDANLEEVHGRTALHVTSCFGQLEIACELMKHEKVDVNHQSYNGTHLFCMQPGMATLKLLPKC